MSVSKLPSNYAPLMQKIGGTTMLGVEIDDCAPLRDLVREGDQRSSRAISTPRQNVDRIKLLVLGTLASTFTYRADHLECGGEDYPAGLSLVDQERWWVGLRGDPGQCLNALEKLAPRRYDERNLRKLSIQLGCRVGDCAMYSITLGIILASLPGLCTEVMIYGKPPHAWVRVEFPGSADLHRLDLARESHGQIEPDYQDRASMEEIEAPVEYNLTV